MNQKIIGIIGAGNVGATIAYTLASKNMCSTILLKDVRENIAKAVALDISQSLNIANSQTKVIATSSNEDFINCDIIVITAGIARKPGMSRDDLLLTNAKIMKSVIEDVVLKNPKAIIIIVSNPLDAMVYTALKVSNFPKNQIIGMAGVLDSARMSYFISEKLGYGQGNIEACVMGGHGDDMVPLPNFSKVEGKNLEDLLSQEDIEEIIYKTKNGGAEIVKLLETGSAYYAPAYSTTLMIDSILNDKKSTFSCAVELQGEYGFTDVVSGVPIVLGKNGVEKIVELDLSSKQKEEFSKSVESVQSLINTLKNSFFN